MKIFIGNDHGGVLHKNALVGHLRENGHTVINVGSDCTEIVRYPHYASAVASAVATGEADVGILICNTGIGMSMIANKYKGVCAALVTCEQTAALTRQHNDANVLCLGGRFISCEQACVLADIFLETAFEGGRHCISLGLIDEVEQAHFKECVCRLEIPEETK